MLHFPAVELAFDSRLMNEILFHMRPHEVFIKQPPRQTEYPPTQPTYIRTHTNSP